MNTSAILSRSGLALALLLLAAAPCLPADLSAGRAAIPRQKPGAGLVLPAAAANPGPAPVVLGGRIPLPSDLPPAPVLPDVSSYVLMDFATGTVLAAKAPRLHLPPASLTKLMTVYLTYRAIKAGTLHSDQTVPVSTAAWKMTGSRMFIQPGSPVTVNQLIQGLMVDSGNDAAVALAQAVAGTQSSFVAMMNHEADRLHLTDTHYTNVDGLPQSDLYTSALDVARLSRVIIRQFPALLPIASEKSFTYGKITQRNWNPVIFIDPSVDGLKTGLTQESGHCIDATALRHGRRLIAVVMGGPSWAASADDIEALLDYGYRFFQNRTVITAGELVGALDDPLLDPVHVPVGSARTVVMSLPIGKKLAFGRRLDLRRPLAGPVGKGQIVGKVAIGLNGKTIATVPAVALAAARSAGLEQRLVYKLKHLW
jgi:D-alanyl-D-alanine carboxypeptidase (penicillin-binding protein 5/6)